MPAALPRRQAAAPASSAAASSSSAAAAAAAGGERTHPTLKLETGGRALATACGTMALSSSLGSRLCSSSSCATRSLGMTKPLVASWADSWVLSEAPCSTDTAAGAIRLPLCHAYCAGLQGGGARGAALVRCWPLGAGVRAAPRADRGRGAPAAQLGGRKLHAGAVAGAEQAAAAAGVVLSVVPSVAGGQARRVVRRAVKEGGRAAASRAARKSEALEWEGRPSAARQGIIATRWGRRVCISARARERARRPRLPRARSPVAGAADRRNQAPQRHRRAGRGPLITF